MKRTLIGAAIAAAAILGGTALAQGMGQGMDMGPGMMGGQQAGQGMAMGPGMMGGGQGYAALKLTDEQRRKIDAIQEEVWTKQGALMGRMHAQSYRMHDFGKGDDAAARKAFDEMAAAQKEMFEARLEARKRIDAVLTPEQRKQLGR